MVGFQRCLMFTHTVDAVSDLGSIPASRRFTTPLSAHHAGPEWLEAFPFQAPSSLWRRLTASPHPSPFLRPLRRLCPRLLFSVPAVRMHCRSIGTDGQGPRPRTGTTLGARVSLQVAVSES
jgi:hypothetical protein